MLAYFERIPLGRILTQLNVFLSLTYFKEEKKHSHGSFGNDCSIRFNYPKHILLFQHQLQAQIEIRTQFCWFLLQWFSSFHKMCHSFFISKYGAIVVV